VAERNNAVQARADLAANLEGVLTAQAVTPTPLPTETVTPIIESEEDAPTPEIPTPTATQDQAATVTVAAVATQLAQVRATQTVIAAMPEVNGTLAIPLKQGDQYRVYLTGFDGQGMNGANSIRVNGHQPTFRRDGQRLIVISTDSTNPGVLSTNLQGTDIQRLIDRSSALWPAISPDGSEIVFADGSNGNQLQWWSADNGLSQVAINNFPIFTRNILWSTNNQLIFHTCENWNGRASDCGTWLSPANQLTPTSSTRQPAPERLLIGNDYFAMGADGNQFVYMARTDGDWEIYLYDLANRTERQLTTNEAQDGLPALSPDGRSIAYLSNESGSWALWTITLATGEKQRWFEINPQRGAVDLNSWADERISWTR
jgi:Tol biopolymer transport system component